jgi:uncharacterized protein YcbX
MPTITNLYRYPIKGLSPEALPHVSLQAGKEITLDRHFALAHGTTEFNPDAPQHLHKTHFLMLMKNERLAALHTDYNHNTGLLQIKKADQLVASGFINEPKGRANH